MSRLLARVLLAILMFPLAGTLYLVLAMVGMKSFGWRRDVLVFTIANIATALFIAMYWVALWRASIKWTRTRGWGTAWCAAGAFAVGAAAGLFVSFVDESFGIFVGGVVSILLWLVATVLIWRKTPDERMQRLRAAGAETIVCPACGYNLTGLKQTTALSAGFRSQSTNFLHLSRRANRSSWIAPEPNAVTGNPSASVHCVDALAVSDVDGRLRPCGR